MIFFAFYTSLSLATFSVQGRTGYPFIDAIMIQLRQEGWIHHLARHAVACFLTRGDLWISWEEGKKVRPNLCIAHSITLGNKMCESLAGPFLMT